MWDSVKVRARRRSWPIHGYVGPNGGGKSLAMVWDTMPTLLSGRPVLSTVRVLDFENPRPCEGWEGPASDPRPCSACAQAQLDAIAGDCEVYPHQQAHPLYTALREWKQLIDATGCDVLLDEVTGVASSRSSSSLPAPIANKLVQLRRADVVVRWSAPAWARADLIIRECSQAVTYCTGYFPKIVRDESGEERLWSQKRLFRWRTFDAQLFEDFTVGKREALSPLCKQWVKGSKIGAFDAYDTYDAVSVIGTVTDAGRCYECGGTRKAPACSCGDHSTLLPTPRRRGGARKREARGRTPGP